MPLDNRSIPLPYADHFAEVAELLPGGDVAWLRALREQAIEQVRRAGLPTIRVERWKYTNLNPLVAAAFRPASLDPAPRFADRLRSVTGRACIVFVNGRYRPDLASAPLQPGLMVASLSNLLRDDPQIIRSILVDTEVDDDPMRALNLAFAADGYVLRLSSGVAVTEPVKILHLSAPEATASAFQTRNLVIAEAGSSATVVESFSGDPAAVYWTHPVCDIRVGPGAALRRYKCQDEGLKAFHIAADRVRVDRDARYEGFVLATGASLSRSEITVVLDGPNASCRLDGGYLARGRQHVDNTTEIVHAKPNTTSAEVYKGVLDDQARGVFQGRIIVEKDAQKSDGHQLSKTILLSDRAEIDTKPELEIFADDVKCSHGATAGALDEDALFYMRARGIGLDEARRLLVEAFIGDALAGLSDAAVRAAFERRVGAWMAKSDGACAT
jgi:Fe-S cluster assembly protein SufD